MPGTILVLPENEDRTMLLAIDLLKGEFIEAPAGSVLLAQKVERGQIDDSIRRMFTSQLIQNDLPGWIGESGDLLSGW